MTEDEFVCAEFGIIGFEDIKAFAPDDCQLEILSILHEMTDGQDFPEWERIRRLLANTARRFGKYINPTDDVDEDPSTMYTWEHLGLVSKVRASMWHGRKQRKEGGTLGAKLAFPFHELVLCRYEQDSDIYLKDLANRWNLAGETCGWEGVVRHPERKIALVDSPIWRSLGDMNVFDDGLGIDYPPFYINGGWLFDWQMKTN